MFDNLSSKLERAFKVLKGQGKISEINVAETIKEITRNHLTKSNGLLFGQCVTAVGWIAGTVPDCEGLVEIPMTDVAGPGFAVGAGSGLGSLIAGARPKDALKTALLSGVTAGAAKGASNYLAGKAAEGATTSGLTADS